MSCTEKKDKRTKGQIHTFCTIFSSLHGLIDVLPFYVRNPFMLKYNDLEAYSFFRHVEDSKTFQEARSMDFCVILDGLDRKDFDFSRFLMSKIG